ncbi:MAG: hypothetical protein C7B43_02985 [Sulfobacillus benefaciens]|uniref:Uncharacterized protein n=1 Tax=Sulfobacillus benefaciens TaxID=453960 RepID=A0A2T2XA73_9FIRM|nr:MAG: hypothetical protein C7B43_02985 [Sulfobacillus benefaciens]HBQ94070.1 hypothetical protein [Sulfobacillus sp.]
MPAQGFAHPVTFGPCSQPAGYKKQEQGSHLLGPHETVKILTTEPWTIESFSAFERLRSF